MNNSNIDKFVPFFTNTFAKWNTKRSYATEENNQRRVSKVRKCCGGIYQSTFRRRHWFEIAGQDIKLFSFLFSPNYESIPRLTDRYLYCPDADRSSRTFIALFGHSNCRYCLSHRIFIPFFLVESVQTVLWYFSFRVSKQ